MTPIHQISASNRQWSYKTAALVVGVALLFAHQTPGVMAQSSDPAISQNPVGVAIALSVEPPAIGYCRDKDAGRAIACALEECQVGGGQSCMADRWCAVAGQAGIMFGYNKEVGQSNLFASCGHFSREGVKAVLKAMCEADAGNSDCGMVTYWSLDGVREDVQPQ